MRWCGNPTLITNELIRRTFNEANADEECAGVITWMHTFSPAKSWILGLQEYRKPLMHFHTQFNQEIPYDTIDMDFMNENQSAHGDREYGHMVTRMGIERKVIVGHWSDEKVVGRIAAWMRTAVGIMESSHVRVARFADNMRNVAVTEGDKVEAQMKFGWEVDAYPVNELAEYVKAVPKGDITALVDEYYSSTPSCRKAGIRRNLSAMWRYRPRLRPALRSSFREGLPRHRHPLWGFGRAAAASRTGYPASHGKGIRIRRRGRLEDGCHGQADEDYDPGYEGRQGNLFHGRLYIQLSARQGGNPGSPHAGGMPHHCRWGNQHQGLPAVHG